MELTNHFRVALPVEQAWAVLTDLERIAPCMPGAQLQEVEGEVHRGVVKVKVGPMVAQYKGQASFLEQDAQAHVAVLRAEGRETRGQGTASATITARLAPDGDGTGVSLVTDLAITGKVAQFGRGVLGDVSAKLLDQFVANLEAAIDGAGTDAAATGGDRDAAPPSEPAPTQHTPEPAPTGSGATEPAPPAAAPAARRVDAPEAVPVDLVGTAGAPVAKRVTPVLAAVALLWVLKKLLARRRR